MSQGQTKEIALRNAQLHFLDQATAHAQLPISWAGMVVVGNTKAIIPQQESYFMIGLKVLTMTIILFLMILLWFVNKNKKHANIR